jgi:hypothetical protein
MNKALCSMFAVLVLTSCLLAQTNQAAMAAKPHQVRQGEQVTIQVSVSPAPNVSGRVSVFVAPEGSTATSWNGGVGIGSGQTNVSDIGISIPIDATLGTWRVLSVRFQPPNSQEKELKFSGSTTFEVVKREAVLPTSADVQVK